VPGWVRCCLSRYAITWQMIVMAATGIVGAVEAQTCDEGRGTESAIAALFDGSAGTCDLNGDGSTTAPDVTAALQAQVEGTRTPTATPTLTSTPTATPTRTSTPPICPTSGADLAIEIVNQSGMSPVSIELSGTRVGSECISTGLAPSYRIATTCPDQPGEPCVQIGALAPGSWRHSIAVLAPNSGQVQHQPSLLVTGASPNRIRFTIFASVMTIQTPANSGSGSLRRALQDAIDATKPLLIQFAPDVFVPGIPTVINLDFALPTLATDDVTIDGTDATGAGGNRIVDARGLAIGALSIAGARNHVVGMRFRNAGGNERDVVSIGGSAATANVIERTQIDGAATADGIGVDQGAGRDFADTANVIRDCDVSGAADKGIKVTRDAYVRVERSWVHDNANGGIQATLGGHVLASQNLVERNRGSTAQNGLSVNANDEGISSGFSELITEGNISRANGANGISVRAFSVATLHDDYVATNASSGVRIFNDVGPAATATVEGISAVCNGVDGAVVANTSTADFGSAAGSVGDNAFAQNNLPAGGANLRNATGLQISAVNNQWEHCGGGATCDETQIAAYDLSDHGAMTTFLPAQAHRAQQPVLARAEPVVGQVGELLRIFGSGFNAIDGHFAENQCADVAGRNRCLPLRGNCVEIDGVPAAVEAVTPTMLVVRWPFTCIAPVPVVVKVRQGATNATSNTLMVCTNSQ